MIQEIHTKIVLIAALYDNSNSYHNNDSSLTNSNAHKNAVAIQRVELHLQCFQQQSMKSKENESRVRKGCLVRIFCFLSFFPFFTLMETTDFRKNTDDWKH